MESEALRLRQGALGEVNVKSTDGALTGTSMLEFTATGDDGGSEAVALDRTNVSLLHSFLTRWLGATQ
jgi:hypothetical protein